MLGVAIVYASLITVLAGSLSLVKPLRFLRIKSRQQGALVLEVGLAVVAAGFLLPARETRVREVRTRLDEFVPVYQFNELHTIQIKAPRDRVYAALKAVTANEIRFFRELTWIRRMGRCGPESILNPPGDQPLLEVTMRSSFLLLADDPGREIVLGTVVVAPAGTRLKDNPTPEDFRVLERPGFAKAAMNFRIEEGGADTWVVTTETRVHATDASARRRFAAYWRVIYPGSALIRRMWLRAVKRRAEAPAA